MPERYPFTDLKILWERPEIYQFNIYSCAKRRTVSRVGITCAVRVTRDENLTDKLSAFHKITDKVCIKNSDGRNFRDLCISSWLTQARVPHSLKWNPLQIALINCSGRGHALTKTLTKWNFLPPCARHYSNIPNLAHGHVIKQPPSIRLREHVSILKPSPVGKLNDLNSKPLSNKMAGYEGDEPSTKFCEILYVGRKEHGRPIRPHDVTIFYKFKSGRGGRSRSQFQVVFTI